MWNNNRNIYEEIMYGEIGNRDCLGCFFYVDLFFDKLIMFFKN